MAAFWPNCQMFSVYVSACVLVYVFVQESGYLVLCFVVVVLVQWFQFVVLLSGSTCLSFVCRFLCRFCGCFACLFSLFIVGLVVFNAFALTPVVVVIVVIIVVATAVIAARLCQGIPQENHNFFSFLSLSNVYAALRLAAAQFLSTL